MFGIGGQELILLMLIGLLVLGPEKLPRIANQLGNWLGQARRMTRVMKRQLEEELDFNNQQSIKSNRTPSSQPDENLENKNHEQDLQLSDQKENHNKNSLGDLNKNPKSPKNDRRK
tara:strand:+ start:338 stop:685 length:348 start_codon:yes stop_codon:yes gene_type:complete